ncbi:low affinity Fe/Cu permease [Mesorhizobium loti]|uniref:Low affinity Fe/Cu permease n=2 Tax=Rhizobium loti TaxID=381 RepID=A0A8E3B1Q0_RHILI|nr:low affinity Fe/Cu permease [Mesorhizobium loti]
MCVKDQVCRGGPSGSSAHLRGHNRRDRALHIGQYMNRFLFVAADFLSRPPGFYVMLIAMVLCTALVPFGLTNVVTYALSVAAIVITGVVLIQGYRDTAAIHAKLDEIIVSLAETRNDVVGLEHAEPEQIREKLAILEEEAAQKSGSLT